MQRKTVHEIVPFRFPLLLSSNGRSGIKREHSEGSYHDNDDDEEEDGDDHDDHHNHEKKVTIFCVQFSLSNL